MMRLENKKPDISHNIRMINWLKAELVSYVGALFRVMLGDGDSKRNALIGDAISGIITVCYLLGKRLGISYSTIDIKVQDGLESFMDHEIEKKYGDMSELVIYMDTTRRKS